MPDMEKIEWLRELIVLTLEDDTMTAWEKFKYINWLIMVTAPIKPPFIF